MPLYVQGKKLTQIQDSVTDFFEEFPHFKENGKELCSQTKKVIQPQGLLYVDQREYAAVTPNDTCIKTLGSDDATTCHIVVMRHSVTKVTCLGHLDGSGTEAGLREMMDLVIRLSDHTTEGRVEVHMIGGFKDSRNLSAQLSIEILKTFHEMNEDVYLETACITDVNNVTKDALEFPVIYGIAVTIENGNITPATISERGPDQPLRGAFHTPGNEKMLNIYDNENEQLTIGPFDYDPFENLDLWVRLPDHYIRQYLSTSPEQEPEHFVANVRRTLCFIHDNPKPLETIFKDGKPRRFKIQEDGAWTLLEV
ncbi:unnamed protein product [Owenia fusiformis]|uniref:Uncharacterized protein n=1 Tax=Owenia fusiformis TaxID=6347 RepID=A0A8J1Y031_OWEFU|nr:unnamed protein product [Owenia fusiformis]